MRRLLDFKAYNGKEEVLSKSIPNLSVFSLALKATFLSSHFFRLQSKGEKHVCRLGEEENLQLHTFPRSFILFLVLCCFFLLRLRESYKSYHEPVDLSRESMDLNRIVITNPDSKKVQESESLLFSKDLVSDHESSRFSNDSTCFHESNKS